MGSITITEISHLDSVGCLAALPLLWSTSLVSFGSCSGPGFARLPLLLPQAFPTGILFFPILLKLRKRDISRTDNLGHGRIRGYTARTIFCIGRDGPQVQVKVYLCWCGWCRRTNVVVYGSA